MINYDEHIKFLELETDFFIKERTLLDLLAAIRIAMLERSYFNVDELQKQFDEVYNAIEANRAEYSDALKRAETFRQSEKIDLRSHRSCFIPEDNQLRFKYD